MNAKKTGVPAFPTKRNVSDPRNDGFITEEGMTLRDYFAAKAMNALLSSIDEDTTRYLPDANEDRALMIANHAYLVADAMLAKREKSK
jgi:hypothetical protein